MIIFRIIWKYTYIVASASTIATSFPRERSEYQVENYTNLFYSISQTIYTIHENPEIYAKFRNLINQLRTNMMRRTRQFCSRVYKKSTLSLWAHFFGQYIA